MYAAIRAPCRVNIDQSDFVRRVDRVILSPFSQGFFVVGQKAPIMN